MSELWEYLSTLEVPDLILCAAAVVILDLFALAVILSANRESKLCQKRWDKVGSCVALKLGDTCCPLEADEILLGRHISADIRIADPSVSRYHAVMTVTGGVWCITDLGSKGGTYVNEARVKQSKLYPGDTVRLGNVRMLVTKKSNQTSSKKQKKKGGR